MSDDSDELRRRSETYIDSMFGPGQGERHSRFLDHLENEAMREMMHRCHVLEGDTRWLSSEENYLLGLVVLCATRSYGPAAMFAKTLRHLGTPREKILEALARLSMWVGPIAAAEASAHVQRALRDHDERGVASLEAWFPAPRGESK